MRIGSGRGATSPRARSGGTGNVRGGTSPLPGRSLANPTLLGHSFAEQEPSDASVRFI
jgi:hypothetical protein